MMIRGAVERALEWEMDKRVRVALTMWRDGKVPFLAHRDDRVQRVMLRAMVREAADSALASVNVLVDDAGGPMHSQALASDVANDFLIDRRWDVHFDPDDTIAFRRAKHETTVRLVTRFMRAYEIHVAFFVGGRPRENRLLRLRDVFAPNVEIAMTDFTVPPGLLACDSDEE